MVAWVDRRKTNKLNDAQFGDLVAFQGDRVGEVGVVSFAGDERQPAHALTIRDGTLVGVTVLSTDVALAGESDEGFAQLAYQLISLGSHVIEQRLIIAPT